MRIYRKELEGQLEAVTCNKCGRQMKVENGILKEGCFSADFVFGYFSERDGLKQQFDLCEKCYDEVTDTFLVPIMQEEATELL